MAAPPAPHRFWHRDTQDASYLISTNPDFLSHSFINTAFATEDMYWAIPLPAATLSTILASSINLGLYKVRSPTDVPPAKSVSEPSTPREQSPTIELANPNPTTPQDKEELEQIGFARFVTDHVTVFYLTDVYTLPECRGTGLGKWLISCCQDIMKEAQYMRRAVLMASPGVGKAFYEKELGMYTTEKNLICMTRKKYVQDEESKSGEQQ